MNPTTIWPRMEALISKQRALLLRVLHHVGDVQHWPMKAHEVSRNNQPMLDAHVPSPVLLLTYRSWLS